jgi:hypothetical protein
MTRGYIFLIIFFRFSPPVWLGILTASGFTDHRGESSGMEYRMYVLDNTEVFWHWMVFKI